MAQSDKDLQTPYIPWQQVIKINDATMNDPTVGDFSPFGFAPAERAQIEEALENIQNTKNGQLLFQSLLAKQSNSQYNGGSLLGKPVTIESGVTNGQLEASVVGGNKIYLNLEQFDKTAFITPEGKKVKPLLEDVVFHELTHAADATNARRVALVEQMQNTHATYGVSMKKDAGDFISDVQLPQTKAFFASLPPTQQEAFTHVVNAAFEHLQNPQAFAAIYEAKLPVLLENPVLRGQYNAQQSERTLRLEAENLAMDRTNAFVKEFLGDDAYTRGSYHQGSRSEAHIPYLPGEAVEKTLTPQQQKQNEAAHKKWVQEYGEHVTSPHSELRDFKGVPIPDPKGRILTDPLPPSFTSLKANEVGSAPPSFTPSSTPSSPPSQVQQRS